MVLGLLCFACFSYQFLYLLIPFIKKEKPHGPERLHTYAVIIPARNEGEVIGELVKSIRAQNYPRELVSVFVVADNCADDTAAAARRAGAVVYERFDNTKRGKGYALDFLFGMIARDYDMTAFDAFLVFDADNLLDENYLTEINRTFSDGYSIITSCRNSKNFGDNWISAGYSLWFLRDSQFMNRPRMLLGTSSVVAGTGFMFSREVLEESGGWKFYLLSEDTEFTAFNILRGHKIGYCSRAVFYDEQPTGFRQSFYQRMRWARGYLQVFGKYGSRMTRAMFRGDFSCFDMIMSTMPAIILMILALAVNIAGVGACMVRGESLVPYFYAMRDSLANAYVTLFGVGVITLLSQWRAIYASPFKKILYLFTFPLFMMTYIPISLIAVFKKTQWHPIRHTVKISVEDMRSKV